MSKLSMKELMNRDIMQQIFSNKFFDLGLVYQIFPIDILPDAIPVLGQVDDAFLLILGVSSIILHLMNTDREKGMVENVQVSTKNPSDIQTMTSKESAYKVKLPKQEIPITPVAEELSTKQEPPVNEENSREADEIWKKYLE